MENIVIIVQVLGFQQELFKENSLNFIDDMKAHWSARDIIQGFRRRITTVQIPETLAKAWEQLDMLASILRELVERRC